MLRTTAAVAAALASSCAVTPAAALNFTSAVSIGNPPSFGDYMVLQQAPARAAIYGMLNASDTVRAVSVSVAEGTEEGGAEQQGLAGYTVQAVVTGDKWKALLHPAAKGGDYSITVSVGTNKLQIEHVTFGDVYYCSGQSNMAVDIGHTLGRNISMDAIRAGKYSNIRLHGLAGNMNRPQPWATLATALGNYTAPGWADPQHPVTCAFLQVTCAWITQACQSTVLLQLL